MTIKPEVLEAITELDRVHDHNYALMHREWVTTRAELMAMDAEIERLNAERSHLIEAMYNNVPAA